MRYKLLFFGLFCFYISSHAQREINNDLEENVNILADNLKEKLSVSEDSLVLKNNKLFSKIKFFNDSFEKTFYFKPAVKEGKISLDELPLGSFSVMFYQTDKIIVFRVNRASRYENTIEPVSDMDAEEAVLGIATDFDSELATDIIEDSMDSSLISSNEYSEESIVNVANSEEVNLEQASNSDQFNKSRNFKETTNKVEENGIGQMF